MPPHTHTERDSLYPIDVDSINADEANFVGDGGHVNYEGHGNEDDPLLPLSRRKSHNLDTRDALAKPEARARNLIIALGMTGFVFMAQAVFNDAFDQWLYQHYQKQVLGANFSQLNVSLTKHPCAAEKNTTGRFDKELNEAQGLASDFVSTQTMLSLIPAIFTNILFGAYADFIGRKVFFVIPIFGYLVQFAMSWAVAFWGLPIELLYVGFAVQGLCGSNGTLHMAMFTYTADNTDEKKGRTLGMVVTMTVSNSLFALSHVIVGHLIQLIGFVWPLAASVVLTLIGLVGIIVFLTETLHREKGTACVSPLVGIKSQCSFYISEPLDPRHRRKDFLMLNAVFVLYVISQGPTIQTFFLMNRPLCWNSSKIGTMETIVGLLQSFCPILVIKLLQNQISDEITCSISLLSAVCIKLCFSMAQADWLVYLGLSLSLMQSSVLSLLRAILSKMVVATQRGSLLTTLAVLEVATKAASGAGLNRVYSATVHWWRGFTYFVVGMFLVAGVLIMLMYMVVKKRRLFQTNHSSSIVLFSRTK